MTDIRSEIEKRTSRKILKIQKTDVLASRKSYIEKDIEFQEIKAQHQKVIEDVEKSGEKFSEHVLHMMHNREERIRVVVNKRFSQRYIWPLLNVKQREWD